MCSTTISRILREYSWHILNFPSSILFFGLVQWHFSSPFLPAWLCSLYYLIEPHMLRSSSEIFHPHSFFSSSHSSLAFAFWQKFVSLWKKEKINKEPCKIVYGYVNEKTYCGRLVVVGCRKRQMLPPYFQIMFSRAGQILKMKMHPPRGHHIGLKNFPEKFGGSGSRLAPS